MSASVLWVSDHPDQRERVKAALESAGFEVLVADENLAALETFQRTRPDVVVIEAALPDTEKLELCQVLKATPQGDDTPVLVVTDAADGMSFRAQAIHQYDADEFIYPFDPSRIAATCKRWLERARAKPRTTPAPHQAALEEALDKLDTLLEEDLTAPAENTDSPIAGQSTGGRTLRPVDPLRESLDELTRMSDELVDRLPIQAHADTVEQTPPGAPKDITKLQQTLQELESMADDEDDAASAEVEVEGDRGEDIQAHLDTMFQRSEHRVDAPVRRHDLDDSAEPDDSSDEGDGEELVTIESEGGDEVFELDGDLDAPEPEPAPEPAQATRPEPDDLSLIEHELGRCDDDRDEAEAAPVAAEIEPDGAAHEPWPPSAIDPSLPRMGVPNEPPRRRVTAKRWAAAAGIVLATGAGLAWVWVSRGRAAAPTTIADARIADRLPHEPAPVEPRAPDPADTVDSTAGAFDPASPAAVEDVEPEAVADPVAANPVRGGTPPPAPFPEPRAVKRDETTTPRRTSAASSSKKRPQKTDDARPAAPRTAAATVVPPKTAPEPKAAAAKPVAPSEPEIAARKPVATASVALGPRPPASPPQRETARTSDASTKVAPPAAPPAAAPNRTVAPQTATDVAVRKAPEPRRKEVREAPPFVETEKTVTDANEVGRPSDTRVAVEPPAPPPSVPVVSTPPPSPVVARVDPADAVAAKPVAPAEPVYEPPRIASRAEPIYPSHAHKAGAGGTVVLDVLVDESGTPVRVVVKEGVGNADLEAAAIHAVLRSSFDPARKDGTPVRGSTTVRYAF